MCSLFSAGISCVAEKSSRNVCLPSFHSHGHKVSCQVHTCNLHIRLWTPLQHRCITQPVANKSKKLVKDIIAYLCPNKQVDGLTHSFNPSFPSIFPHSSISPTITLPHMQSTGSHPRTSSGAQAIANSPKSDEFGCLCMFMR